MLEHIFFQVSAVKPIKYMQTMAQVSFSNIPGRTLFPFYKLQTSLSSVKKM